jgi:hypothetical protein
VKKGIWEDGKRIMWIDSDELVRKIQNKEIDYRQFMEVSENQSRPHVSDSSHFFAKPVSLETRIAKIISDFKISSERHSKSKEEFLTQV